MKTLLLGSCSLKWVESKDDTFSTINANGFNGRSEGKFWRALVSPDPPKLEVWDNGILPIRRCSFHFIFWHRSYKDLNDQKGTSSSEKVIKCHPCGAEQVSKNPFESNFFM
jgi:hypothetical protein